MENGSSKSNTMHETLSDTTFDFNLMDELMFDGGLWVDGSNFWQQSPTPINNSPPFFFPSPQINLDTFVNETEEKSNFPFNNIPQMDGFSENQAQNDQEAAHLDQSANIDKSAWVGLNRNPTGAVTVKKKLELVINSLKDYIKDKDVLIQIWYPIKRGGRLVLTTRNQPYSVNHNCKNLEVYRDVSRGYQFAADNEEFAGLPGRVFLKKLPEWTPDVRFFKREEYPRVNDAQKYDVRGSLALPVFEHGSGNCLGVVEIVTMSQIVNNRPQLENICKALEAVDLKSSTSATSTVPFPTDVVERHGSYEAAHREIEYVLKCVCDTHNLPLAQTWVPCSQQGKGGCRHSDENYTQCVSTLDSACYVVDPEVSGFHEACSDYHLLKGEGIAGGAFLTNQPCFTEDITVFSKTEYPLAHHARVFNLCAAVAIRLRSTYTGTADYVLEFFLPINCKDPEGQRLMLDSLSGVIQQTCQSLRVVTDDELAQEILAREAQNLTTPAIVDNQEKGKGVAVDGLYKLEPEEEFNWNKIQQDFGPQEGGNFSLSSGNVSLDGKTSSDKRRPKTEKNISLQVLRQYFAGSLKDAAKSIGVCPTTLKRICRQHGITRWPSRKIKKVGHSLKKLQVVIDSVQGAEGSIQLSSFYHNFPELVSSPNKSVTTSHLPSSTNPSSHLQAPQAQEEGTSISPITTGSKSHSSSGSHSSGSSFCCSTGVKQSSLPTNRSSFEDALSAQQNRGIDLGQDERKTFERTLSYKSTETTPQVAHNCGKVLEVGNFRVKATYGEEKIRMSLQAQWRFKDLQEELFRRFNVENGVRFDLKYLDDDSEWVLLTCDADLEECIDIHRSSKNRTIKISLNQSTHHPSLGSSFGSNSLF